MRQYDFPRWPARLVFLLFIVASPAFGGPSRPCDTAADCLAGQECYFPLLQDCSQPPEGYCVASAPPCDPDSGLVCGCDGRTYTSECEAEGRTWIESVGVCQTGTSCGGQTCTGNNFCQLPPGACSQFGTCYLGLSQQLAETLGMCVPYPASCPNVDDPVCSCYGGTTYANACEAARDLQSVAHSGTCSPGCGGFGGGGCQDTADICVRQCHCIADLPGQCEPLPLACDDTCAPVCACGDLWFKNRCEALVGQITQGITLDSGCDEVGAVRFISKTEMMFAGSGVDLTFNVYQAPLTAGVSPTSWSCIASGLTAGEHAPSGAPGAGEVWAFTVSQVEAGAEGPLGWGGDGCTERINATPCPP